jgi:hypothetical protein
MGSSRIHPQVLMAQKPERTGGGSGTEQLVLKSADADQIPAQFHPRESPRTADPFSRCQLPQTGGRLTLR